MASPRYILALVATLNCIAISHGGPLGPLPNVTSTDIGLKEGSCSLGDVVYLPGDEFPGASPCERCSCTARGVQCEQQQCEPRPGCKALHRPDHCCPTYQCECEQEGRVYGNGEKLVDPLDPCRVCYCQGGEVVCRRIACFVRDDCTPRLVPGRCCPEYDNCPLRGVTSLPGMTPSAPSVSTEQHSEPSAAPTPFKQVKQEITIKEITPVSEIPILTDVKIKEILPSPSIEVAEYSSSKSPLITREATSEKPIDAEPTRVEPEVIEIHSSPESSSQEAIKTTDESKSVDEPPSKISLSTQDSINSEIYPSVVPIVATMGVPAISSEVPAPMPITTKAPIIEEEDPSLFIDHNPAFPPLPDDLSVLSSHGDELIPEPSADEHHSSIEQPHSPEIIASVAPSPEAESKSGEVLTTTHKYLPDMSVTTTEKSSVVSAEMNTIKLERTSSTEPSFAKESPTVNLRSAIPTEILSAPAEEITVESNGTVAESSTTTKQPLLITTVTTEATKNVEVISTEEPQVFRTVSEVSTVEQVQPKNIEEVSPEQPEIPLEKISVFETTTAPEVVSSTLKASESFETEPSSNAPQEQTTNSIAKSNIPTEVTSQTELSSLPIETSDQNPHDASENVSKESFEVSTEDPLTTVDKIIPSSSEVITVSKANENGAIDNVETTEFILTSFGSSESATDNVELIKIAGDSDKSAAIIDNTDKNALTDLIKLVHDMSSISDHTESTHPAATTSISDSEELIPVNAGYKSKNSNFNQNSITEMPVKSKSATPLNKQKIIEIEDDESGSITDSPPPNDNVEPTTRRPIIDNVSDDMHEVKSDKKDIEIITQSYVPTINKRPHKVILQEEKSQEMPQDDEPVSTSMETATEAAASAEMSAVTGSSVELATADSGPSAP